MGFVDGLIKCCLLHDSAPVEYRADEKRGAGTENGERGDDDWAGWSYWGENVSVILVEEPSRL